MNKVKNNIQIIITSVIISCLACACGKESSTTESSIDIYYINKSETQIVSEKHDLESTDTKGMIVEVLKLLCTVPENKDARSTLPTSINIINYSYDGEQVTLSLGDKYKEQSHTTEILARAAIVKTLTQIDGVGHVLITINGEPIKDSNGNDIGVMNAETFIDNGKEDDYYAQITLRLYMANETGDKLIPINRELVHNADVSNVSMERLVVEQLIAGPVNTESYATINPETKVLAVTVTDGICYVNLDSAALVSVGNATSDVTIYSIVNSLSELGNINKVQILIDGSTEGTFRDKYSLTTIFERNLDIVE